MTWQNFTQMDRTKIALELKTQKKSSLLVCIFSIDEFYDLKSHTKPSHRVSFTIHLWIIFGNGWITNFCYTTFTITV